MNITPKRVPGGRLEVRAFQSKDGPAMWALFERIPLEDRAFFAEDVTTREEFDRWLARADGEREFVRVAVEPETWQVVGAAALERQLHGWSRHVGELRIVLDPACRGLGYGAELARHVFDLAIGLGLEKMMVGMVSTNLASIRVFERFGFQAEALLVDHVKDTRGEPHDLLLMSHSVANFVAREGLYGLTEAAR